MHKNTVVNVEKEFEQNLPVLRRWLVRKCRNNYDLIEDVIAKTRYKVYTNISLFDGRCSFLTWIITIAGNTAKDEFRRMEHIRKHEILSSALIHDGDGWKEHADSMYENLEDPINYENLSSNQLAIEQLQEWVNDYGSDRDKEIFRLYFVCGFIEPEISEILKIARGTVKSSINRLRHKLNTVVEDGVLCMV